MGMLCLARPIGFAKVESGHAGGCNCDVQTLSSSAVTRLGKSR